MLLFYPEAYTHLHVNNQETILSCSFFYFFAGKQVYTLWSNVNWNENTEVLIIYSDSLLCKNTCHLRAESPRCLSSTCVNCSPPTAWINGSVQRPRRAQETSEMVCSTGGTSWQSPTAGQLLKPTWHRQAKKQPEYDNNVYVFFCFPSGKHVISSQCVISSFPLQLDRIISS